MGEFQGKRLRYRTEDNITVGRKWKGSSLVQDTDKWLVLVNTVIDSPDFIKFGKFFKT